MSLNDSAKQLKQLSDSIGSIQKLVEKVKVQAVESSGFSDEDKKKMNNVLKTLNFDELAKKNTSPEELKTIIENLV